jgi:hypothetical protein
MFKYENEEIALLKVELRFTDQGKKRENTWPNPRPDRVI